MDTNQEEKNEKEKKNTFSGVCPLRSSQKEIAAEQKAENNFTPTNL